MITPKDHQVRTILLTCSLIALLMSSPLTAAIAQVVPPLTDPPPGSTLTETTVRFTGENSGQVGEQHWLTVGTSVWDTSIFHKSLGPARPRPVTAQTVVGLPTSGTLYVRYWTYTPVAGWQSQAYTYTMNVPSTQICPEFDSDCLINAINTANSSGNPELILLENGIYDLSSLDNGDNLLPRITGNITIRQSIAFGGRSTIRGTIRFEDRRSQDTVRTFDVAETGTLVLEQVFFVWGGTVVHNRGTATLREVEIRDNRMIDGINGVPVGTGLINQPTGTMTIQDSTITDYVETDITGTGGGAVQNYGTMTMTGSTIKRNFGFGASSGGIANSGMLTITRSFITRNRGSDGSPGAISNNGHLELIDSVVGGNDGWRGGLLSRGEANISGSIFTDNTNFIHNLGGAILNEGPMTISRTVIAGNTADEGAGIYNLGAELHIDQSHIYLNKAKSDGGGIKNVNGLLTLTDTVVTNNTPDDCVGCP